MYDADSAPFWSSDPCLAVTLAGWIVTLTKIRFGRMKKHWETLEAREHRWPTRKTMGNHEQL